MTLFFPTEKSFYKADNLFRHDFMLRQSFDTMDLLWYRSHEAGRDESQQGLHGLDDSDHYKIERTVDNCPDNELEISFKRALQRLSELQTETEIFDFYYEFYYTNLAEVIRDDGTTQRSNEILRDLRVIETDELSSDYEKFWDYVYEKTSLKAMLSPQVLDHDGLSPARTARRTDAVLKNKTSDLSDATLVVKGKEALKHDETSLMNARFLLQQLKDKGLEEDRLTYVNIFAEGDEEEDVEAEYSSSGTLSTELEASTSLEASGSRLTEISFEKETAAESEVGTKDPFVDRSFDSLYYMARLVHERLVASSQSYFSEAPIILLENDLVMEMKERELKYVTYYNKVLNQSLVKVVDMDGVTGFSSRPFHHGMLKMINELTEQMEQTKQEGVKTKTDTKRYSEFTYDILRSPKVEPSGYRKLVNFDLKSEEEKSSGQKRKIKHFKTMVCLAGRTKLRRYDFSEKITEHLNNIRFPIRRLANLTKTAREHATLTVNGYMETLVKLTRKRMFYQDYPRDLYSKVHLALKRTDSVIDRIEQTEKVCKAVKERLSAKPVYKPLGRVLAAGQPGRLLDRKQLERLASRGPSSSSDSLIASGSQQPCFVAGHNVVLKKTGETFDKTTMPSQLTRQEDLNRYRVVTKDCFEIHGFPKLIVAHPL